MNEKKPIESCRSGRVLERRGGRVLVRVEPSTACSGCALGGACGGRSGKVPETLWAKDPLGALPGQRVELAVEPRREVEIACLLYLLPAISLVLGAALGQLAGAWLGLAPEYLAPVLALVCAATSLLLGRAYAARKGDLVIVAAVMRED